MAVLFFFMIDFAFFRKYPIVNYKGYSSKA